MRFKRIKKRIKSCVPSDIGKPLEASMPKKHPWNTEVKYAKELPPKEHKKEK